MLLNCVLAGLPVNAVPELMYGGSTEAVQKLSASEPAEEIDLVQLGKTPDLITPHPGQYFSSFLRRKLLLLRNEPILTLLTDSKKIQELLTEVEREDNTPQVSLVTLYRYLDFNLCLSSIGCCKAVEGNIFCKNQASFLQTQYPLRYVCCYSN